MEDMKDKVREMISRVCPGYEAPGSKITTVKLTFGDFEFARKCLELISESKRRAY